MSCALPDITVSERPKRGQYTRRDVVTLAKRLSDFDFDEGSGHSDRELRCVRVPVTSSIPFPVLHTQVRDGHVTVTHAEAARIEANEQRLRQFAERFESASMEVSPALRDAPSALESEAQK